MFFSKSKNIIGIDIGTSHIKAVELKPGSPRPFLASYGIVNVVLPQNNEGKVDTIQQIAEVVKALHEKAKFTTKQAIISLPSNVAFVSVFDFPKMSDEELGKAVEYKARQFIPLPLADVNFSWQIIGSEGTAKDEKKTPVAGAEKVMVLLTAVPKNVVNNYAMVMEQAGYQLQAIEIESISAIRSLIDPQEKDAILIVDVGAKATILSLSVAGHLFGSRHLSIGGDTITSSIAKSLGITYERAEQLKRSEKQPDSGAGVTEAAESVVDLIKGEVSQMIKISENQGKAIDKILLSGGGSRYRSFGQKLKEFNIPIENGDPLQKIAYDENISAKLHEVAVQLPISIGLALRSME